MTATRPATGRDFRASGPSSASAGLPALGSLLAVCAHPDDESFGMGALLSTFAEVGTVTSGLCLTQGEASTLRGPGDLAALRRDELEAAAQALGIARVDLLGYPDGELSRLRIDELAGVVAATAAATVAQAFLVFDEGGITGHPDHRAATQATVLAAQRLDLPVLAWAIPAPVAAVLNAEFGTGFVGRAARELDRVVPVDRGRQRQAIACHASQSSNNPVLWRRLDLLGDRESMRWLRSPGEGA